MSTKIQPKRNPIQSARASLSNVKKTVTAKVNEVKPKVEQLAKDATKVGTAGWKVKQGVDRLKEVKKAYTDVAKHKSIEMRNGKKTQVIREPFKEGGVLKGTPAATKKAIKDASNTPIPGKAMSGAAKKLPKWMPGSKNVQNLGKAADKGIAKGTAAFSKQELVGKMGKFTASKQDKLNAGLLVKNTIDSVNKFKKAAQSGKDSDWSDARKSAIDTAKGGVLGAQATVKSRLQAAKKQVIDKAMKIDLKNIAKNPSIAKKVANPKVAAKVAERAAAGKLQKGVFKTTIRAAERFGSKGLAKTASRFVPGANVAIAGLDVANAVNTQRDSRKTNLQKAAAWITAGGSVASATNIPVVSQVGAGVSFISDAVGAFLPDKK